MTDRDPYTFTNGECADKLEEFLRVAKDRDPVGWPRAILPYIERAVESLRNPAPPFRGFIADADRAPLRKPNGRNDHGDLGLIRRATQPPAVGVDEMPSLPPLPRPWGTDYDDIDNEEVETFTASQMKAYARAAIAALRTGGGE